MQDSNPDVNTAVLRLRCPDQPGVVAQVASLLASTGANIEHAEQHGDQSTGVFFQRIEFTYPAGTDFMTALEWGLAELAPKLDLTSSINHIPAKTRVAILCSKQGHCLYDLLSRWELGEMPGDLRLVASNHDTHKEAVERTGVPFHHLPVDPDDRRRQQEQLLDLLQSGDIDLVIMARYMQILPDFLIDAFKHRIINIHHSFLPAFPGGRPYHQAHARGVKLVGATAHYATVDLDEGPIIEQDVVRVNHRFSPEALARSGRDLEMVVLSRAVRAHLEHRIVVHDNRTIIFG
ncbi:MAG: formyltetrahydrofolate deformylase [Actinomycetota bacterium]